MRFFVVLLLIIITACCEKEESSVKKDENGVIIGLPWLWRTKLSVNSTIGVFLDGPVYYNGVVLLGSVDENDLAYFTGLDIETGKIIWKQNYIYQTDFFGFTSPYIKENKIICIDGFNLFQINMTDGNYLWKERINVSYAAQWLSGIDSLFFVIVVESYPGKGYPVESGYYGNIENGNIQLFLIPDMGELPEPDMNRVNISIGGFRFLKPFYDEQTDDIMLLCYYEKQYYLYGCEDQISKSYVGL